jgi:hypothetical protein
VSGRADCEDRVRTYCPASAGTQSQLAAGGRTVSGLIVRLARAQQPGMPEGRGKGCRTEHLVSYEDEVAVGMKRWRGQTRFEEGERVRTYCPATTAK